MADLDPERIAQAEARGRAIVRSQPHAASARYDATSGRIIVDLTNGATFTFPPRLVEGLAGAPAAALGDISLLGNGYGLHWEELDLDYSVPGLVAGIFGTARWMAAEAGRATSPAKAAAARANGVRGGRPRKAG